MISNCNITLLRLKKETKIGVKAAKKIVSIVVFSSLKRKCVCE